MAFHLPPLIFYIKKVQGNLGASGFHRRLLTGTAISLRDSLLDEPLVQSELGKKTSLSKTSKLPSPVYMISNRNA
jgi:hypothetical protein